MQIDIAFSFDANYYKQAYVAIASLLHYSKEHPRNDKIIYNLHLLINDDVTENIKDEMMFQLNKYYDNFSINFIQIGSYFANAFEIRGISNATYSRLLLHNLLPDLNKIIYSDVDVIFNDDLFDIENINIDNYYYGAVIDAWLNLNEQREANKLKFSYWNSELKNIGKNYHCAGFLILNLKKLREIHFEQIVFNLVKNNYTYQDQDILNIAFVNQLDKVYTLSCKYGILPNCLIHNIYETKTLKENIISEQELYEIKNNPAIYHWAGGKPWNKKIAYDNIWWNFCKKTPYYEDFKNHFNEINHINPAESFYKKIIQKIFSIRNEYRNDTKHKIWTILGIKIKFKIKPKTCAIVEKK